MEKNQKIVHWKKGDIYTFLADANPAYEGKNIRPVGFIVAKHHETQEGLRFFEGEDGTWYAENDDEHYTLYRNQAGEDWARESYDFHGYKEKDGIMVKRFEAAGKEIIGVDYGKEGTDHAVMGKLTVNEDGEKTYNAIEPLEGKYQRPEVDIEIPDNYVQIVDATLKSYKEFLDENMKYQEMADQAETEEEREKAMNDMTKHFKDRFAGILAKDQGDRLSVSQVRNIWKKFMKTEYRSFLKAHINLSMEELLFVGVDKFVYVMGFKKPSDVASWRNNKVRLGVCCHCKQQFIPMIMQYNHGLCTNCKPEYSAKAIRNFILHQMNNTDRYHEAHHDMLMDFYIIFYHDDKFRRLFLNGSTTAKEYEEMEEEVPEWAQQTPGAGE